MRVAIFGTGGVGGYFGGRLAEAGEDVIFIARGEHLQKMQRNGLRVDSVAGDFLIDPVQATDDPAQAGQVDVILVGVKAWQVPAAAVAMQPLVGPDTFVVPLQNGVEAPGQLAAVLGKERVLGGFCRVMSFIEAPGHIRHAGIDPYIAFGELDNRTSDRAQRLQHAFSQTKGVTAEIPADIHAAMWRKFLFIASISGVGAVTRAPADVMRTVPETRRLLEQAMEEVVALAQARDVALTDADVSQSMATVDNIPAGGTASMQRDILEGRPSELESQNGAVVRLAQEAGVAVPLHTFLYGALLPLEQRARGEIAFPG